MAVASAAVDLLLQPVDVSEQTLHLQVIVLHMVWFLREPEDCALHGLKTLCSTQSSHTEYTLKTLRFTQSSHTEKHCASHSFARDPQDLLK